MARHQYILLSTSVIGVIVVLFLGKAYYENRREELYVKARAAFAKALEQELSKRDVEGELAFVFDIRGRVNIKELPDTIYWTDKTGRRKYILQPEKHRKNVTEDPNIRALHSYALQKMPIIPDTLNLIWQNYLRQNNISYNTGLRIEISDKDEKVTSLLSADSKWLRSPIVDCTIGYRCEIEVMGYLEYGIWQLIGIKELGFFLLYCLFITGVYKIVVYLDRKVNRPPIIRIKEVPTVELVKDTDKGPIRIYRLGEKSIFYAKQKKIVTIDKEERISPQNSVLLETFLNAKDYVLSDDDIMKCLWPDGSGTIVRLHKAINRLREVLKMEPQIYIERVGINAYQMYM